MKAAAAHLAPARNEAAIRISGGWGRKEPGGWCERVGLGKGRSRSPLRHAERAEPWARISGNSETTSKCGHPGFSHSQPGTGHNETTLEVVDSRPLELFVGCASSLSQRSDGLFESMNKNPPRQPKMKPGKRSSGRGSSQIPVCHFDVTGCNQNPLTLGWL